MIEPYFVIIILLIAIGGVLLVAALLPGKQEKESTVTVRYDKFLEICTPREKITLPVDTIRCVHLHGNSIYIFQHYDGNSRYVHDIPIPKNANKIYDEVVQYYTKTTVGIYQ